MISTTASRLAALALAAGLALPALAQDAQTGADDTATEDAPAAPAIPQIAAEGLDLGTAVGEDAAPGEPQVGQTYVRDVFTDWEMRCVRAPEGERDFCQLYQLLRDQQDNPVAEISLYGLPDGGQANAGATIVTPLETLLTEQLTVQVDQGQAKRYPFTWCSAIGCFARVGFTADEVNAFRRGNAATISIRPVAAPDQVVQLGVSLSGFTAGLNAVNAHNAGG